SCGRWRRYRYRRRRSLFLSRHSDALQIALHSLAVAELQRIGDQCMTNGNLSHTGHRAQEVAQIGATQIVTGIDRKASLLCRLSSGREVRQLRGLLRAAVRRRVGFGVQLDTISANGLGE